FTHFICILIHSVSMKQCKFAYPWISGKRRHSEVKPDKSQLKAYPVTKHVRLYTQVYSGYGESLIDYNFNQTRVGVGVMLNDIF
ncbi:phospholipase A, partial [Salmonella enterica subsp. enterica serovar Kentucky]|nr:phospholipase A [Salmonella enterica subsp. enterica serovar Kentucky]